MDGSIKIVSMAEETGLPTEGEKSESARINELLDQGYTAKEIVEEFGFARSTVHREAMKRTPKQRGEGIPTIPAKLGGKDLVPPEHALQGIRLQDGDYKVGFIDGMAVLLMAARYNQLMASNQAEILRGQLDIYKAAQEGTERKMDQLVGEFAMAVQSSNQGILSAIQQQGMASARNPMGMMMFQAIQPFFQQALGQVFAGLMGPKLPGPPPQGLQGPPSQGPNIPSQGPDIEKHSIDELEEEE